MIHRLILPILQQEVRALKKLLVNRWYQGPEFLWDSYQPLLSSLSPSQCVDACLDEDDPEIKPLLSCAMQRSQDNQILSTGKLKRFSSWSTLRRAIARLITKIRCWRLRKEGKIVHPEYSDYGNFNGVPSIEKYTSAQCVSDQVIYECKVSQ